MAQHNRKRYYCDGLEFRSTDEVRFWEWCKDKKAKGEILNFEYEPEKIEIMPKFRFHGELVRAMTYTPDFILYHNDGTKEYIEVKGFFTEQATLKVKLFKYILSNKEPGTKYRVLARNLKHANIDGEWIEYDELQKLKRKAKREKNL